MYYIRTGESRRFAYIGYKSQEDAQSALDYYNGTYIHTSKISVEFAKMYGDNSLPRPWSAHSKGSSAYAIAHSDAEGKKKSSETFKNDENPARKDLLNEKLDKFLDIPSPSTMAAAIMDTGRLFVRNLSYETTEDDLRDLFVKYGPLSGVSIPLGIETRKSKGFGYVTFMMPSDALRAWQELDGTIWEGRLLHILPAKDKNIESDPNGEDNDSNFKNLKKKVQKASATNSTNWNSLFMNVIYLFEVLN